MFIIFSVFYILVAAAMIVLILLQRGAGADAGSGFGGGASATVFGARGSASFLTRATAVLATLFFILSLGMGIYLSHGSAPQQGTDLGIMGGETPAAAPAAAPASTDVPSAAPKATPATNNSDVPAAPQKTAPPATEPAKK
jgi:preprotein translocase subunit SecG